MSYYERAFTKLIQDGVPRWYIKNHLLTDLAYFSKLYVYYNPYDIETEGGWYATNGICVTATPADNNRRCWGELANIGFPTWKEYTMLFEGEEYDAVIEAMNEYDVRREEWIENKYKASQQR